MAGLHFTGVIRDFSITFPDFDESETGSSIVTGLVSSTLGEDGTPTYVATPGSGGIQDATTFAQWWHDGAVNQSTAFSLDLTGSDVLSSNYAYENAAFFPIDGALIGNEGSDHNYHFTTQLHAEFTYRGGETIAAATDDDCWVYVNGTLALDLGGLHPVSGGNVSLDGLGLVAGQDYDIDVFFAERHSTGSELHLETNALLLSNRFTNHADTIDFDFAGGHLSPAGYYDAQKGDDYTLLPSDASAAATLGYDAGNTFHGGDGNDTIVGRGLDDIIAGDGGNDTIAGGAGIDSLSGGAGADRFVFASSSDIGNATHDTIGDFSHKDIIDLTGINTGELGGAGFTVVSAFGGHAGELVVTKGLTSATLSGDIDGDGTADFVLDVGGVRNLHADDLAW